MSRLSAVPALAVVAALAGGCREKSASEEAKAAVAQVEGIDAVPASADVILGAEVPLLARSALVERAIAGMRFDTPANAKAFTDTVTQQLQMAKGQQMPPQLAGLTKALEKAQVKQNGNDTIVQLALTAEELKQLGAVLQQMGQAFGQMGGGAGAPPQ